LKPNGVCFTKFLKILLAWTCFNFHGSSNAQDISAAMCDFTLIRLRDLGIEIRELNISNIASLPYKSNYFDVVFHFGGINWISNKVKALAEMVRVCKNYGQIGIVDEFSQPSFEKRVEFAKRMKWDLNPSVYYSSSGFSIQTDKMLNTGVLVMQPKKHGEFLKSIYDKYIRKSVNHPKLFNYEQSAIGYELQVNNMFTLLPVTDDVM
jgi:ubiquinone/menaquinone biosynthesis C-methylase UbiE